MHLYHIFISYIPIFILFISFIHYSFAYLLFIILLTIYYSLFTFTIHYSLFTIHYSYTYSFTYLLFIHYSYTYLFTYLGENPYLVEFDETPRFWYSRVAHDAWINFVFWYDQFSPSESRRSEKVPKLRIF